MSIRLVHLNKITNTPELTDPVGCTTEYDGQSYYWGPGQVRVVPEAGVGDKHRANVVDSDTTVVQDQAASGLQNPCTVESRT